MRKKRILLVDDQGELRQLLRLTFDEARHEIQEADNGLDAVRLAKAMRPDVIVLDVMMPGELDGLQACEAIRKEAALRDTHIILLTARAQASDREMGIKAGADDYLTKPFSPIELYQLVDSVGAKS